MRHTLALYATAVLLGSSAVSASPREAASGLQFAQVRQETRDVLEERRDLRDAQGDLNRARRDFRQADTPRERQMERRDLQDARRDVREERRDVLEERRDLRDARTEQRRDALMLQPDVRTRVQRYVTTNRTRYVEVPYGFSVAPGAVLPGNIVLQAFPADVGLSQYQYVIIGQQSVLVEPRSRRIVEIIR